MRKIIFRARSHRRRRRDYDAEKRPPKPPNDDASSCLVLFVFSLQNIGTTSAHRVYNNTYKITDFTEILDCPEYSTYGIISRKFPSMNIICVGKVFISSSLKETSVGKCLLSEFDSFVKSRKLTFFITD